MTGTKGIILLQVPMMILKVLAKASKRSIAGGGYHTNKVDIRVSARHFALVISYHEYVGFRCGMDGNE